MICSHELSCKVVAKTNLNNHSKNSNTLSAIYKIINCFMIKSKSIL